MESWSDVAMRILNVGKLVAAVGLIVGLIAAPAHAQSDWKKQWEATVDAGRKEGEVVIYGPHNPVYQQVW